MVHLPHPPAAPGGAARFLSGSAKFGRWYFPGRGLGVSLILHAVALTLIGRLPIPSTPEKPFPKETVHEKRAEIRMVMYLPRVGGGAQGSGAGPKPSTKEADEPRLPGQPDLTYPGPQWIQSDTPQPTSRSQTLLQPNLKDLPILSEHLELPNLLMMPRVAQPRVLKARDPAMTPPKSTDFLPRPGLAPARVSAPQDLPFLSRRLDLPKLLSSAVADLAPRSDLTAAAVGLSALSKLEEEKRLDPSPGEQVALAVPELENLPILLPRVDFAWLLGAPEVIPAEELGQPDSALENLTDPVEELSTDRPAPTQLADLPLSLLPIGFLDRDLPALLPGPETITTSLLSVSRQPGSIDIPASEARGRFTISPKAEPDAPETKEGSGSVVQLGSFDQASESVVSIRFGPRGSGGGSSSSGAGAGSGEGSGSGPGTDSAAGDRGSGRGTGAGPGSGAGRGPGSGPFPGITIIGADRDSGGSVAAAPDRDDRRANTRYQLFVLSTEKSGGGLPYFGVFPEQRIRTVFVDVREREIDPPLVMTIEFGIPPQGDPQRFDLPSLSEWEYPLLREEWVQKHLGKMLIVFGVISSEGKIEQLSIMESPDSRLDQPVLDTLQRWIFRPGTLDAKPVAVRTLLGIPLRQNPR